jgi:xanthine/CO dehydrogenase XdhC/CoxF family maturation factor
VSGGCIEGAVYEEAQKVIQHGRPKLLTYGRDFLLKVFPWCGSPTPLLDNPRRGTPL